ncbi:histidine kinase [Nibribacter ruber]|uniref:Histidine kinase n=1 Tax=Nibribacter ruber TaxID=2698458 RepID=A0A6P1P3S7_9BACT|nr:CZB domain-containing protein [Nibribacter ruber]QHL89104.1 histidine kinase [Nibribacter ruber]
MIHPKTEVTTISSHDFEQARIKHVLFKSKLRALLFGASIDPEPVLSNNACSLGQWIKQVAFPQLGDSPDMHRLDQLHDQLHDTARHLYQLYQNGKQEQAQEGLAQVDALADAFLHLLTDIEKKALL